MGKITKKCKICHTKFKTYSKIQKFCSHQCQGIFWRGKNNPRWSGGKTEMICQKCGESFKDYLFNKKKYCSSECYWKSLIGKNPPMTGRHHTEETKKKISEHRKGISGKLKDNVGYVAIHQRIKIRKLKPIFCEICKNKKRKLELSNKDHIYSMNLKDWQYICRFCHRKVDKKLNKKVGSYLRI